MSLISILVVCSGNICRSPLAESVLRKGLEFPAQFDVHSAGTIATDGEGMPQQMSRIESALDLPSTTHRARQLTTQMVAGAGLLLGMERAHRRAIVELVPRKVPMTFTYREFARLAARLTDQDILESVSPSPDPLVRFSSVVARVSVERGQSPILQEPSLDDVVDPFRQNDEVYALSASQIVDASKSILRLLRLAM